ncbi:MAG: glycyl-radical enzyme activating protein [Thermovirgaceae bacterium]
MGCNLDLSVSRMVPVNLTGMVLRFERTSMYDGDGLRTVVYLKGCPLQCEWCSTPESINPEPEIGYDLTSCTECHTCVEVCPENALKSLHKGEGILLRNERCTACFRCIESCPTGALKAYGKKMNVEDVLGEIEKDEVFFFHSNGGVTLSGGEPLQQADFCREILKGCKQRGINTAMETSSFAPWDRYEENLPLLDTVYTDIKCFDSGRHEELTGVPNEAILENIKRIDASVYNVELVIRIPLVPGRNDSYENLEKTLEFCNNLKKIRYLELLPYHRFGVDTYGFLGLPYVLKGLDSASVAWAEEKAEALRKTGTALPIRVSGNEK